MNDLNNIIADHFIKPMPTTYFRLLMGVKSNICVVDVNIGVIMTTSYGQIKI